MVASAVPGEAGRVSCERRSGVTCLTGRACRGVVGRARSHVFVAESTGPRCAGEAGRRTTGAEAWRVTASLGWSFVSLDLRRSAAAAAFDGTPRAGPAGLLGRSGRSRLGVHLALGGLLACSLSRERSLTERRSLTNSVSAHVGPRGTVSLGVHLVTVELDDPLADRGASDRWDPRALSGGCALLTESSLPSRTRGVQGALVLRLNSLGIVTLVVFAQAPARRSGATLFFMQLSSFSFLNFAISLFLSWTSCSCISAELRCLGVQVRRDS